MFSLPPHHAMYLRVAFNTDRPTHQHMWLFGWPLTVLATDVHGTGGNLHLRQRSILAHH